MAFKKKKSLSALSLSICLSRVVCITSVSLSAIMWSGQCVAVFYTSGLIHDVKSCFPSFSAVTQHSVYFSSLSPWFWFVQLEVVERNRCVCICQKTKSSDHSSVAFDSSGCIWLCPDKTWAYIESDSVELLVHTWCFGTGLLGWALAWWRIPSPLYHHPPYGKSHSGALRLELSGKGEGCIGPQAMSVA